MPKSPDTSQPSGEFTAIVEPPNHYGPIEPWEKHLAYLKSQRPGGERLESEIRYAEHFLETKRRQEGKAKSKKAA